MTGSFEDARVLAREDGVEVTWVQGTECVGIRLDDGRTFQYSLATLDSVDAEKAAFGATRGAERLLPPPPGGGLGSNPTATKKS